MTAPVTIPIPEFPRNKTTAGPVSTTLTVPPPSRLTTPATDPDKIPVLASSTALEFVAEGAANILFRCTPPPTSTPSLLRLRKTLPSSQPNLDAFRYLSTTAFPLFPPHLLVATSLIQLPPGLVTRTNGMIRDMEAQGTRLAKREGLMLEEQEEYGLLVADMSPRGPHEVLIEFKPKWAVQSPSAPAGWKRCRTCALRSMKAAHKGKPTPDGFCPLDLSSGEASRIRRAVEKIIPQSPPSAWKRDENHWPADRIKLVDVVTDFLHGSELIPVIAALQKRLDPDGPLGSTMKKEFLDAMTVRDLTIFLRVSAETGEIECGVGDLDLKTGEGGKRHYWRETERKLVEEGWYMKDGEGRGGCGGP
ncbi:hypothetical protein EX30DRAFT_338373 [Ascodesmis nigricans]|uniref:Inositol-pentakisphosphate 2-kinase n=1 Tax=Ascodesmis nigricans TaxID=341454 RepID=A0A4S2N3P9_9PEZI|nr:hypothetical protein EX30DRAFT_338373 [Ascodesmis nigricans]